MRWLAVSFACLAVAGCNLVSTSRPMIGPETNAPRLRDGLWATQDPHCTFDTAKPVRTWPSCAAPFALRGGVVRDVRGGKALDTATYRISPGSPWLVQIGLRKAKPRGYVYAALEPTARDAQGRITALSAWIVVCGPPAKDRLVTEHPFPGLTLDSGKNPAGCTTRDLAALRTAAKLSRVGSAVNAVHWVRASTP